MAGFVPSESILGLKSRSLRHSATPMRGRPKAAEASPSDVDTSPLVDLYTKHQGRRTDRSCSTHHFSLGSAFLHRHSWSLRSFAATLTSSP